jgi:TonB family protein
MSGLALALTNLVAWSAQVAALALVAAALFRLVPVERPALRLALGQSLLALMLRLPLLQPWRAGEVSVVSRLAPWSAAARTAPSAAGQPLTIPATAWTAFAIVLGAGATLRLGQLASALIALRLLGRGARPLEPPRWLSQLRDEVAPRAHFVVSDRLPSPATFGFQRALVVLPASFESARRETQAALALHELLHVRRGDWLALVAEELVKAVLFFHPAVHWLVSRIRLAREQCIDAAVVQRLGGRQTYLESLVESARARTVARAVPAAPFFHESHLRERVDLLLKEATMSSARALRNALVTAATLVVTLAFTASAVPLQSAAVASPAQPPVAVTPGAEPKLLHKVNPVYPEDAKADKVEGKFLIDAVIGTDGAVRDAHVVASSGTPERVDAAKQTGDPRLAKAAVEAVRAWRYEPVLKNGQPVEAKMTITIVFRLS